MAEVKAFLAVTRFNSFTKASQFLHLSQPTITAYVKHVEEALNLNLFDRSTRRVSLTRAGSDLVPMLERLAQQFDTAMANAESLGEKQRGMIRLACLPSVACTYLPQAIAQFRRTHPQVSFVLKDAAGRRIVSMVEAYEVEFGITDGEPNWPDLDALELFRDHVHVIFPKAHPIARRKKVTLNTLLEYPLILMDPATSVRVLLDEAVANAGRLIVPACEVTYVSTAIGMVRAGLGLAVLSSLSIKANNLTSMLGLRSRRIDSSILVRRINLIKRKGRSLTPSAKAFADMFVELSKGGGWLSRKR